MKRTILALIVTTTAAAQTVPYTVRYTGKLTDGGVPVTGVRDFDFRIFDDLTAGAMPWSETHLGVTVEEGLFSVTLGETTPLTPAILAQGDLWLETRVDGTPLSPRFKLHSVPFAIRSAESETLEGLTSADFLRIPAGCSLGEAIEAFDGNGDPICASIGGGGSGDITGVTAGAGLTGGGLTGDVMLDVDFPSFGQCAGTDKVAGWDAVTGALLCEPDLSAGGSVTLVETGPGLTGGPITSTGQIDLNLNTGGGLSRVLGPGDELGIAPSGVTSTHIADGTIVAADIAANTIGAGQIATGGVESAEIADGTVTFADWASNGCTNGQVPKWSGAAWQCAADSAGTGTVTSVGSGSGLTGGPITTAGTLSIATGGVTSTHIQDGTVAFSDWASNGCANGQVPKWSSVALSWGCGNDLDTNSGGTVTSVGSGSGLTGGPITTTGTLSIATNGVTSTHIANGTITGADIDSTTTITAGNYLYNTPQTGSFFVLPMNCQKGSSGVPPDDVTEVLNPPGNTYGPSFRATDTAATLHQWFCHAPIPAPAGATIRITSATLAYTDGGANCLVGAELRWKVFGSQDGGTAFASVYSGTSISDYTTTAVGPQTKDFPAFTALSVPPDRVIWANAISRRNTVNSQDCRWSGVRINYTTDRP